MKLFVISNPSHIFDEVESVTGMLDAGLETFHVRKPDFSRRELETYLNLFPVRYHPKMVIHSHHDLIETYNLKGIHYSLKKKAGSIVININDDEGWPFTRSISLHSLIELEANKLNYNYAFFSPVFRSISKKDYDHIYTHEELKNELPRMKEINKGMKIIALGGVTENNLPIAKDCGFDGIALLGAIWQLRYSDDRMKRFLLIKNLCTDGK